MENKRTEIKFNEDVASREMIPGKTKIGNIDGRYNGIYREFKIYYGNIAEPVINDTVLHLPPNEYMDMLREFLASDEGQEYRVPTGGEVKQAINDLLNKEHEISLIKNEEKEKEKNKQLEEQRKKEESKQLKEYELKTREINVISEQNKLKKIEIKKFTKTNKRLTILCVTLIVLNLICMAIVALFAFNIVGIDGTGLWIK